MVAKRDPCPHARKKSSPHGGYRPKATAAIYTSCALDLDFQRSVLNDRAIELLVDELHTIHKSTSLITFIMMTMLISVQQPPGPGLRSPDDQNATMTVYTNAYEFLPRWESTYIFQFTWDVSRTMSCSIRYNGQQDLRQRLRRNLSR